MSELQSLRDLADRRMIVYSFVVGTIALLPVVLSRRQSAKLA